MKIHFSPNQHSFERALRFLVALLIAYFGYMNHAWWGFLSLIPFITSLSGWCPLYALFGFSTCSIKQKKD